MSRFLNIYGRIVTALLVFSLAVEPALSSGPISNFGDPRAGLNPSSLFAEEALMASPVAALWNRIQQWRLNARILHVGGIRTANGGRVLGRKTLFNFRIVDTMMVSWGSKLLLREDLLSERMMKTSAERYYNNENEDHPRPSRTLRFGVIDTTGHADAAHAYRRRTLVASEAVLDQAETRALSFEIHKGSPRRRQAAQWLLDFRLHHELSHSDNLAGSRLIQIGGLGAAVAIALGIIVSPAVGIVGFLVSGWVVLKGYQRHQHDLNEERIIVWRDFYKIAELVWREPDLLGDVQALLRDREDLAPLSSYFKDLLDVVNQPANKITERVEAKVKAAAGALWNFWGPARTAPAGRPALGVSDLVRAISYAIRGSDYYSDKVKAIVKDLTVEQLVEQGAEELTDSDHAHTEDFIALVDRKLGTLSAGRFRKNAKLGTWRREGKSIQTWFDARWGWIDVNDYSAAPVDPYQYRIFRLPMLSPAPAALDVIRLVKAFERRDFPGANSIARKLNADELLKQGAVEIEPGKIQDKDLLVLTAYGPRYKERFQGSVAYIGEFRMYHGAAAAQPGEVPGHLWIGDVKIKTHDLSDFRIFRLPSSAYQMESIITALIKASENAGRADVDARGTMPDDANFQAAGLLAGAAEALRARVREVGYEETLAGLRQDAGYMAVMTDPQASVYFARALRPQVKSSAVAPEVSAMTTDKSRAETRWFVTEKFGFKNTPAWLLEVLSRFWAVVGEARQRVTDPIGWMNAKGHNPFVAALGLFLTVVMMVGAAHFAPGYFAHYSPLAQLGLTGMTIAAAFFGTHLAFNIATLILWGLYSAAPGKSDLARFGVSFLTAA